MQRGDQKLKLNGEGRQICGTIALTFKFAQGYELQYNQKSCFINDHTLEYDECQFLAIPKDLNIEYCYTINENEEIKLDVKDYHLDDISDFEQQKKWQESKTSKFFIPYLTISPDHRYIIICVAVELLQKIETQRIIIIDTFNPNIKKVFFRTSFMGYQKPQFSKDGNFAFINITKNEEKSRFLILNLKNGIQEEKIIKLHRSVRKIDYDAQSGCLFYITNYCKIHQSPLNQDGTIDKSKKQIYRINVGPIDLSGSFIALTLLSDSMVLVVDDIGRYIVSRIRSNCKTVKSYLYNQYLPPQYTFKKAFVVMADSNSTQVALLDVSRGKLIRSIQGANYYSKVYGYHQKDSYFLSFVALRSCKETNHNQVSVGIDSDSQSEMRKKRLIFDFIRGTEIEIQGDDDASESFQDIFTRNITMRLYDNKLSYKLKL
ncbi:unnamed protein product [Paramecium octaurelia]|uniref:Uncharacterized protein n=1 Tax=Paramecium octaurelia TaxID=43137 RepID=A0A8S1XB39_PAROT|nr:unnamed protein product [Paramecium octaurelia]